MLAPIYETVHRLAAALPGDVTYMVEGRGGGETEHAVIRQWALTDPDGFQPLIDLLTTSAIEFLDRQIEAGAEAIQLFES
jgi:uroporphyrinogen decarboxylase